MVEGALSRGTRMPALSVTAVILGLVAFPLLRPNILGERFALVGLMIVVACAFFVLVQDHRRSVVSRASGTLIVFLGLAQVWAIFRAPYNGIEVSSVISGSVTTLIAVVTFALLLNDPARARLFARTLVTLIVIISASSVVTAALAFVGVAVPLFTFPITAEVTATTYFPFTITSGSQWVFGVEVPRFTGLGREPGWMGMYAAVAWLLWPHLFGSRGRLWRLVLVFGALTPLSTAGFGIFVVVAAFELFLRPRADVSPAAGYFRQLFGVTVFVMAVWLAVTAPVFGLDAKTTQNAASLSERNAATADGLRALTQLSLGDESTSRIPGVNLIAAVAETGWPYSLLISLAVLLPLAVLPQRREAAAPVAVIFLTLLLAQPPGESTTVFVLAVVVYAVAALAVPDAGPSPSPGRGPGGAVTMSRMGEGKRVSSRAPGGVSAWAYAGAAALAIVVTVLAVVALQPREVSASPDPRPSLDTGAFATPSSLPPVAVFLGDSYTAGAGGTGEGFTGLMARGQSWTPVNLGRGGTGFLLRPTQDAAQAQIACGKDYCESYAEMIPAAVAADPDVVVVAGGRNDVGEDPGQVADAIESFFIELRDALPDARIIVLSPLWDDTEAPAELGALGVVAREAAAGVGAEYVDIGQPLADRPEFLSPDGVHPNDAGYAAIATAIAAAL